ncbi:MAG: cobalt ECF transporter T component CbiQ [Candidatus Methanoperedens sp.]|nr:cobalt ECF transporter T component CbiQ [Candidatus Methanoperedens sp.]MCZ7370576.1 cobalt ECF transporter T component CbiQ [Candidatus Methanoperedens sp.]
MLEWLTRDPLNGLAVTIAFFISMIAGRYIRKNKILAPGSGSRKDPRVNILVSFLLIIAITLMRHWYFPVIISISCVAIALKLGIIRDYSKKLIFPVVMALFIIAVQGLNYGKNVIDIGIISFYAEGLEYGFIIFTKVIASTSILILLISKTSENELLESMRWFRVPGTMIEISGFMLRYVRTFSEEGRLLKLAQESRCSGCAGFTNRMHNTASIIGMLITRAFSRGEEVYRAMVSRAWSPMLQYPCDIQPLSRRNTIFGILLSSGIICLVFFDRFL